MNAHDPEGAEPDERSETSRRQAVGLGLAAVGAVWAKPAIQSVNAAAASTQGPPP